MALFVFCRTDLVGRISRSVRRVPTTPEDGLEIRPQESRLRHSLRNPAPQGRFEKNHVQPANQGGQAKPQKAIVILAEFKAVDARSLQLIDLSINLGQGLGAAGLEAVGSGT